jgi:RsiW-degrading membrane proteinase PrsW (M82 family)
MIGRYAPAAIAGIVTVAADAVLLFARTRSFPLLLVAAIGPPLTALLLGRAAAGGAGSVGKLVGGVVLGATVVPFLVVLTHGGFAALSWGLVAPLADAGTDLLDQLEVDPTLLDVFGDPWALLFLVQLAVVAPLSEEFFKPLGAILLRASSRSEAFLTGAAVGAGFAAAENILYASGWWWSYDSWLPIAILRSAGAGLHLLGAGLVTLAVYEWRTGTGRSSILKTYGLAGGLHALWNGGIAVMIILFTERHIVAGGLSGSSLSWGISLAVYLGALGVLVLGGMVVAGRWSATTVAEGPMFGRVSLDRPAVVAGWAAVTCAMLIPLAVMILVFPRYLAL